MPDIAMCSHPSCPSRQQCLRHRESGTVPGEYQWYDAFEPGQDGRCEWFVPRIREKADA